MKQGCLLPPGLVPQPSPHLPHSLTLISSGQELCLLLDCSVHTDAAIKPHQCPQSPHNPGLFDLKEDTVNLLTVLFDHASGLLLWVTVHMRHVPKIRKTKQHQRNLQNYSMIRESNQFHEGWFLCMSQHVWQDSCSINFHELAQHGWRPRTQDSREKRLILVLHYLKMLTISCFRK